jgi:hypothetical protein
VFNHEKLDVYRMAVEFDLRLCGVLPKRGFRALRDQAERRLISQHDYDQCRSLLSSIVKILSKLSRPPDP